MVPWLDPHNHECHESARKWPRVALVGRAAVSGLVVPLFAPPTFRDLAAKRRSREAMLPLLGVGALLLLPGAQHRPAPRRRCGACVAAELVPLPTSPKDVATQMSYAVQART